MLNLTDLYNENARLFNKVEMLRGELAEKQRLFADSNRSLENKLDSDGVSYRAAEEKYAFNRKTKTAKKIFENFSPQRTQFESEKSSLLDELKDKQYRYNTDFTQDFVIGLTGISEYREAANNLKTVEMIRYEEKLRQANIGKKHTEESKLKMSLSRSGEKHHNFGKRGKDSTRHTTIYMCSKDGELLNKFDTLAETLKFLGLKGHSDLYKSIKNKTLYKGYYWSKKSVETIETTVDKKL